MEPKRMATPEELASIGYRKPQEPMLIECPVYKDDLDKIKEKKRPKDFQNDLSVQMYRLMEYKRVCLADISKATGIALSTLYEWSHRKVQVQMLDDNIKKLARYFDVSIDFLVYSTPITERDLYLDDKMPDVDQKWEGAGE